MTVPYFCAEARALRVDPCIENPSSIDPAHLAAETQRKANGGWIDPTSNLGDARVFIFQGTLDAVIDPGGNLCHL